MSWRSPQLPPQPGDVDVHGLVGAAIGQVPHLGHDLASGDHDARARGQERQQLELAGPKVQAATGQSCGAPAKVDAQLADDEELLARRRLSATQDRGDARVEMVGGERFDDVVVGSVLQQIDDRGVVVARGGDDDRHAADRAQHAQELGAVDVGEAEIENDQVETLIEGVLQARPPRCGPRHRVSSGRQGAQQGTPDPGVVLDEQQRRHARTVTPPGRRSARHFGLVI